MKLRNKRTGEIGKPAFIGVDYEITILPEDKNKKARYYNSLAELNKEWEDCEEPEEDFWYIDSDCETYGVSRAFNQNDSDDVLFNKSIGNYFKTKEEAEKAVEKLKALTKLCKKGFEFNSVEMFGSGLIRIEASIPINEKTTLQERSNIIDSLYLLFGGEE